MQGYKVKSIVLLHGIFSDEALKKLKFPKSTPIFVCEGRPSLEAGKKNCTALLKKKITPTVICDNMAGFLFLKGLVKGVVLACQFADETGALCDTGALILAVLAKKHNVAVQLAQAQRKTRFLENPKVVSRFEGQWIAPQGTHGYVPLVEWVPAKYLKSLRGKKE